MPKPFEVRLLNSDGVVHTEVQMKAGGSRGHGQTVLKQQCDLQLEGPEQRAPRDICGPISISLNKVSVDDVGTELLRPPASC